MWSRAVEVVWLVLVCITACCFGTAQQDTGAAVPFADVKPVPVFSGGIAFVPSWDGGKPALDSIVAPVLLVPLGNNFVMESRAEFEGNFQRRNGNTGDFSGGIDKSLDYAELDYIGNRYVTVTLGRFLAPFNIFNERLYPAWIRNSQTDPLIFPLGTGSDDGIMLRGGLPATQEMTVTYAAYFSALEANPVLQSERHAGIRAGVFLSQRRLEFGGSVQHQLQSARVARYGLYAAWQPLRAPFELRSEGVYSHEEGKGFWVEGAYRFRDSRFPSLRRTQLVLRTQMFGAGSVPQMNSDLPSLNTKRTEFGVNYYLNDGWKALASYGRTLTAAENSNIWTVGMTYRFVFPLGVEQ